MKMSPTLITSLHVDHYAERKGGHWYLSSLPGRKLTQQQAMSGIMLAEAVGTGSVPNARITDRVRQHVKSMGMSLDDALAAVGARRAR